MSGEKKKTEREARQELRVEQVHPYYFSCSQIVACLVRSTSGTSEVAEIILHLNDT